MGSFTKKKIVVWCFIIGAAALVPRVQFIACMRTATPVRADGIQYLTYAHNLAYQGIFSRTCGPDAKPDSFRSPGFPLFVALFLKAAGNRAFYPLMLYAQALLGALTAVMIFLLGLRFLPFRAGAAAGLLAAAYPHGVVMGAYFLTETLFCFFLVAGLLSWALALGKEKKLLFPVSALCFGGAYLTNETSLFLPLFLAAAVLIQRPGEREKKVSPFLKRGIALFTAIYLLFPALWMIRNHMSLDESARRGEGRALASVSYGTYPAFSHEGRPPNPYCYNEDPMQPAYGDSLEVFLPVFWDRAKKRPLRYALWYLLEKPYYFWRWAYVKGEGVIVYVFREHLFDVSLAARAIKSIMRALYPILLFFSLAGLFLYIRGFIKSRPMKWPNPDLYILFLPLLYYTALFMVFFPLPRYSVPLRPLMFLWALAGFCLLKEGLPALKKLFRFILGPAAAIGLAVFLTLLAGLAFETRHCRPVLSYPGDQLDVLVLNSNSLVMEGLGLVRSGKRREAEEKLQRALFLNPKNAMAWLGLGNLAFMDQEYAKAGQMYAKSLEADPFELDAKNGLAICLANQGKTRTARTLLKEVLKEQPDHIPARKNLARLRKVSP